MGDCAALFGIFRVLSKSHGLAFDKNKHIGVPVVSLFGLGGRRYETNSTEPLVSSIHTPPPGYQGQNEGLITPPNGYVCVRACVPVSAPCTGIFMARSAIRACEAHTLPEWHAAELSAKF